MQTAGHAESKPREKSTSADVRRRALTCAETRVIDRLDKAMKEARVSGPTLATALGIKPQSFTNLRRKPVGGMRAELLAKASAVLQCDLYWLCTGEGGEYVHAHAHASSAEQTSLWARQVAEWIDSMSPDDRWRAYAIVSQMARGNWPSFDEDTKPDIGGR
jgi:hypothetical protein